MVYDDLGAPVPVSTPVRRVVSLVPSLTETLASVDPTAVVGATDYCTHPAGLPAARVRGTKNPDRAAILALRPDLVVANQEENRELDVRRLREAGVPVWVTVTESVPGAIAAIERLLGEAMGWPVPAWLTACRDLWCGSIPPPRARVAVPIWRDPWMVVGGETFIGDLLRRAGLVNVITEPRYPYVDPAGIHAAGADLVLLPDEPYEFTAVDGPEAFDSVPTRLVSGRLLTWYGPSLLDARTVLDGL